jgi:hypothetical protein
MHRLSLAIKRDYVDELDTAEREREREREAERQTN